MARSELGFVETKAFGCGGAVVMAAAAEAGKGGGGTGESKKRIEGDRQGLK